VAKGEHRKRERRRTSRAAVCGPTLSSHVRQRSTSLRLARPVAKLESLAASPRPPSSPSSPHTGSCASALPPRTSQPLRTTSTAQALAHTHTLDGSSPPTRRAHPRPLLDSRWPPRPTSSTRRSTGTPRSSARRTASLSRRKPSSDYALAATTTSRSRCAPRSRASPDQSPRARRRRARRRRLGLRQGGARAAGRASPGGTRPRSARRARR